MLIINDYFHNPFHRSGFMANLGKKVLVYSLCSMLASPFMVLPRQAYANTQNYTVFSGGTIYTMTESLKEVQNNVKPHKAKAVVVDNKTGKIIKVFKENENADMYTKNANYKQVNLGTNVMLPGFIDPHGHFPVSAANITGINLNPAPIADPGVNTLEQLQQKLLDHLANNDYDNQYGGGQMAAKWVSGSGYDDTLLDIKRHPTKEELMVGALANKFVKIGHSSGHMAVVNTKALERLFESRYLSGKLTSVLRDADTIGSTEEVTSATLVKDTDGLIKYQVTLNTGAKQFLSGIQMRQDGYDGKSFASYNTTNEQKLFWFTGLLQESGMDYVASMGLDDMVFIPNVKQFIPYAAKEYMSRGVTSGNDGGGGVTTPFSSDLDNAQDALANNRLPIRTVIQPRIYLNFGEGITPFTVQNHYSLNWQNIVTADGQTKSIGEPSQNSPQTGDDMTSWYGGTYDGNTTPPTVPSATDHGMPGDQANPSKAAYKVAQMVKANPAKYKDRIILGTWKYNYDGSIQGYTGYLAQQGYYQKPKDVPVYNPGGRTGVEGVDADYVVGGTPNGDVNFNDPKYFCFGGNHYGNEKSLGNGTYTSVAKAIKEYHLANQGVSLHLNGSWANDDVINFVEQACYAAEQAGKKITDRRHTVIHAQMQDLSHIQRMMGNYDQFPISNPNDVKRFTNVWSGVNAMTWVKDTPNNTTNSKGYNPEEGHYLNEFTKTDDHLGERLRKALGGAGEQNLIRQQNMISSYFVDHTYYWGERHRDIFMGPGRAYNMSPMGWAVKLGHRYTFHNDTPVTPQNPLKSISIATTRLSSGQEAGGLKHAQQPIYSATGGKEIGHTKMYYPTKELADEGNTANMKEFHDFDQRITVLQALHAVTVNSAFSSRIEDRFGSIKEGYHADFVILANDPFVLEKQGEAGLLRIADIPVVATIVANEAVFGFTPGTEEGNFVSYLESSFHNSLTAQISNITEVEQTADEMEAMLNSGEGQKLFGAKKFTADVQPNGATAIFSVQVMGNGLPINSLNIKSLANAAGVTLPYQFTDQVTHDTEGMFWVTTRTLETLLPDDTIMEPGKAYYIHFTIKDGGSYDLDGAANGTLEGQLFVTSTQLPVAPTALAVSSGGGGGCTIGTSAQYDLALVILAAFGLLAIRIYRKRDNA